MSQKPLLTYTLPSTIFAPVWVGVSGFGIGENGDAYRYVEPTFSKPELGYRYSRYRLEYRVVSWSGVAPSTSTLPRIRSQARWARFFTASKEVPSGISWRRLSLAWSTLMSEVARRRVTVRSAPASKRRWPLTPLEDPSFTGLSNTP